MSHQQLPTEGQDEEYDVYLFWPSLSSRDVSSGAGDTPSSPLYGPVSLDSESTEYDYSGFSSGPPSPITFAHTIDFQSRFPIESDFGSAPSGSAEARAESEPPKEHKKTSETAKYSRCLNSGCISRCLFVSPLCYSYWSDTAFTITADEPLG
ncbi:hypothetical protein BGY98DRAFT_1097319 [Russula aff. rugulosa BPL654]|nr:hypothetical protein BGY98DRAFT_1097319 [Russula aff. rugulosa BPL654]